MSHFGVLYVTKISCEYLNSLKINPGAFRYTLIVLSNILSHSSISRDISADSAIPALFTEVLGQVCAYSVLGRFAEQKICLLDGFDNENVGVVEGYDIVDKELVKK